MDADLLGQAHHVHAGRTAGADQGEVARVVAAFDGHAADAVDHVQVDQGGDAEGGTLDADAQRVGDPAADGVQRRLAIEADAAAEQRTVGQVAQGQVGVGHGRLGSALAVAHRPGLGSGAARADLEHAELVEVGDGAAPRAEGFHLDHWHADALAEEVHVLAEVGAAGVGQGDVEGGAAHVHGNDVIDAEGPRHRESGLWRRGRAGVDGVDRAVAHHITRCQPAVGLEVAHRLLGAEFLEQGIDALHIARHHRAQVGVDHGGGGAGVFADLREDLDAGADEHTRQGGAHQFGGALLMAGVAHRPDEGDGHRLHALGAEVLDGFAHGALVQRAVLAAVTEDAAADGTAQMARHQHVRRRVVGVVAVAFFLVAEADFQAVFVAGGAEQADLDPGALDQRVEGDCGAVDAQVAVGDHVGRRAAGGVGDLREARADGQGAVLRGGGGLEQLHAAVAVGQDEVGEGAAGVDAQAILVAHVGSPVRTGRGRRGWRFRRGGRRRRGSRRTPGPRPGAIPGRCERPAGRLPPGGAAGRRSRRHRG
ncbi:hypothetical protein D3C80_968020 [compost metagenome]